MNKKIAQLGDEELVSLFRDSVVDERRELVKQLEFISELDRRKLFFHHSSLWAYLVQEFGMEEWQAEKKIKAVRLMRKFPQVAPLLESGKLNLSLLELAQGCAHREKLSETEFSQLLDALSGLSCRRAKREIAARYPESLDLPKDKIRPLSGEFSEVSFVASEQLLEKIEDIRDLLAHSHPGITIGEMFDLLATEYRERHHPEEKAKRAQVRKDKSASTQRVPDPERRAPTQSQVHELVHTDGYICSYKDPVTGQRCTSKRALQKDHLHDWSYGGDTTLENLRFLCRSHHRRVSFLKHGDASKYSKRINAPDIIK